MKGIRKIKTERDFKRYRTPIELRICKFITYKVAEICAMMFGIFFINLLGWLMGDWIYADCMFCIIKTTEQFSFSVGYFFNGLFMLLFFGMIIYIIFLVIKQGLYPILKKWIKWNWEMAGR